MGSLRRVDIKYRIELAEWNEGDCIGVVVCRVCGKEAKYEERADLAAEAAFDHMMLHEEPGLYDEEDKRTKAAVNFEHAYSVANLEGG